MLDDLPDLPVPNPSRIRKLDMAAGFLFGLEERAPLPRTDGDLAAALDRVLLPAVQGGRCFVAFSGGRDSSFALAATTRLARRHGLPDPVPVTVRYRRAPAADEGRFQEEVVAQLGLRDWERIEVDDELEITGPHAARVRREAGLLFPANAHLMLPAFERARGGTMVLGVAISDFFLYWYWQPLAAVLAGRRRPRRRDARLLAFAALPGAARARLVGRFDGRAPMPWLRPDAEREAHRRLERETAAVPRHFARAVERQRTHRCFRGTQLAMHRLAEMAGTRVVIPFLDDGFLATARDAGGRVGLGTHNELVARLAGDVLPAGVLRRRRSVPMQDVLVGERTRTFVRDWTGRGVPEDVVDAEALRGVWRREVVDWRSSFLLQAAIASDESRTVPAVPAPLP